MADNTRRKPAARQPITSHPLFPAVVVLWFGALFGLVSLAIHPTLIERLVHLTTIDRFIPMAAPPLGTTTRILLALLMTTLGCLIGALMARVFGTRRPAAGARRRRAVAEAEPGSPVTSFGSRSSVEGKQETEDLLPSHKVLQRQLAPDTKDGEVGGNAPLRAGPQVLNVADLGPELEFDGDEDVWASPFRRSESGVSRLLEPEDVVAGGESAHTSASGHGPLQFPGADDASKAKQSEAKRNRLFDAYAGAKRVRPDLQTNTAEDSTPAPGFASLVQDAPDVDSTRVTPEPDTHVDKARRAAAMHDESNLARFDDGGTDPTTQSSNDFRLATPSTAAERIASAPLEELSHLELLERLALALERRRAVYARLAAAAPYAAAPFGFDAAEEEDDENVDQRPGGGYSSLLDLSMRMVARPLVQSEGLDGTETPEPVVMFPAHQVTCVPESRSPLHPAAAAPRSFDAPRALNQEPDETERALQDALAKLQRMSGAA
ncbi:hypothetical protein ABVV53_06425 [Novosphingobium sp. RD2P27]|uniref:Uncharacterized protein n=1 Tax=Novosphingobium kalidii TaxID=3230299 RepID=A0ABV2CZQ8_9SPHN